MKKFLFGLVAFGLLAIAAPMPAPAATLWNPNIGTQNFPGLSPSPNGSLVTPLVSFPLQVDSGTPAARAATASSGAATLNTGSGVITSESLTTAAGATYTLTLTDSQIAATDIVQATVSLGSATTGIPTVATVKPAAGSVTIVIQNIAASAALNGTIKIAFVDFK